MNTVEIEEKDDFTNPKKLKAFFEEIDEEIRTLSRDRAAENSALELALMAMLTALDDQLPAVRSIVVHALDEAIEGAKAPSVSTPPNFTEAAQIALEELRDKIHFANKLIEDE